MAGIAAGAFLWWTPRKKVGPERGAGFGDSPVGLIGSPAPSESPRSAAKVVPTSTGGIGGYAETGTDLLLGKSRFSIPRNDGCCLSWRPRLRWAEIWRAGGAGPPIFIGVPPPRDPGTGQHRA